jgi:hypothetical protein
MTALLSLPHRCGYPMPYLLAYLSFAWPWHARQIAQ